MKKIIAICLVSIALSGCASTGQISPQVQADIQQARVIIRSVCGVLPNVADIVALFSSNPTILTAEGIAAAFCSQAQVTKLKRTPLYRKYRNQIK